MGFRGMYIMKRYRTMPYVQGFASLREYHTVLCDNVLMDDLQHIWQCIHKIRFAAKPEIKFLDLASL